MIFIREKLVGISVGVIIILLLSSIFITQPKSFKNIQLTLYDLLLSNVEQSDASGLVSIIDIDEKSLKQYGQWPWPRNRVAELLENLKKMQPLSIGVDFLFAESDRSSLNLSSLNNVFNNIQKHYPQASLSQSSNFNDMTENEIIKLLQDIPVDNDHQMAKVLATGPFILGYSFLFEKNKALFNTSSEIPAIQALNMLFLSTQESEDDIYKQDILWYQATGLINNLNIFSQAAPMSGFFNISPDHDGVIRKVPLVMQYKNELYPSLSLATLMTAIQAQQVVLKKSNYGIDRLIVDEQEIPIDKQGYLWIHFRNTKKSVFNTISAADILNNKIPFDSIANHIILIGTSAKGLFDLRSTPYNPIFTGVEVHATVIDNIIRGDFINHPPWSRLAELALLISAGLLSLVIVLYTRAILSFSLNLLLISILFSASWWWLHNDRVYLSVFYPIISILLNYSILSVLQYRYKEKKLVYETLEHNQLQQVALEKLVQAKQELQVFSDGLEEQVKDRTKELAAINQHTRESIEYASLIQRALIPDNKIFRHYFKDSFVFWDPKDIVGGDIYLMESINDDELLIMVIDCTGHGVPGAFVTMLVKAIESQIIANIYQGDKVCPASMLSIFNRNIKHLLNQENEDSISNAGFDGCVLYYNKKENLIRYAGANTPLFVIQKGELDMIKGDRHSIGYNTSETNHKFTNYEISTKEETLIYLSTDGYLDQKGGAKGFPFGKKRFKKLIQNISNKNMGEQKKVFIQELRQYYDKLERVDDITLIGIKV